MQASEVLQKIKENRGSHEFVKTGFRRLDELLDGGLLKKELVIVGGSTGTGKSYFAIHLAKEAAAAGFKTAYLSLEISGELVVARMIGMEAGLKSSHILYGVANEGDRDYLKAQAKIMGLGDNFHVYDDIYEIEKIDEVITGGEFECVYVDFIQNVMSNQFKEYDKLSFVSLHFQRLAKKTNSCIVVLSQLSNEVSREGSDKRPVEYKGSGAIATVADLGFFLSKIKAEDDLLAQAGNEGYELLLAKNRRGPSRQVFPLRVQWPGGRFYEHS